jgi:hypothetical protein
MNTSKLIAQGSLSGTVTLIYPWNLVRITDYSVYVPARIIAAGRFVETQGSALER